MVYEVLILQLTFAAALPSSCSNAKAAIARISVSMRESMGCSPSNLPTLLLLSRMKEFSECVSTAWSGAQARDPSLNSAGCGIVFQRRLALSSDLLSLSKRVLESCQCCFCVMTSQPEDCSLAAVK